MKRKISLILAICLILTNLAGCSSSKSGRGGDFVYYLSSNIRSLDPQTAEGTDAATVINAMFEGLCRIGSDGTAQPGVAESWSSSADYTTFTFVLNEDCEWSNGTAVTAHDFVYGIQRALAPATGAEEVDDLFVIKNAKDAYYGLCDVSSVGVTASDDHTLVFTLDESCPDFPIMTAGMRFMPCNEEFFKSTTGRYGLGSSYLITNGPFTFPTYYSWQDGEYIELEPYDNYQGETVSPSTLTFYLGETDEIIADPVAALTDGTTDVLALDSQQDASDALSAGCTVYTFSNRVTGLLMNTDYAELTSKVREILVKTIDRESVESALSTSLQAADDIVPPGLEYNGTDYRSYAESSLYVKEDTAAFDFENYETDGQQEYVINDATTDGSSDDYSNDYSSDYSDSSYDNTSENDEEDSDYLVEGQYEEVTYIPSITIMCIDDFTSIQIANAIIASWNQFDGAYFNIDPVSESEFLENIENKDYEIALYTVESTSDTALSLLARFESDAYPQLLNSPAYDTLLHTDNNSITDITALEKFLNNQYIFYPIYYSSSYYATAPNVSDVQISIGTIDFIKASK